MHWNSRSTCLLNSLSFNGCKLQFTVSRHSPPRLQKKCCHNTLILIIAHLYPLLKTTLWHFSPYRNKFNGRETSPWFFSTDAFEIVFFISLYIYSFAKTSKEFFKILYLLAMVLHVLNILLGFLPRWILKEMWRCVWELVVKKNKVMEWKRGEWRGSTKKAEAETTLCDPPTWDINEGKRLLVSCF